jgi:hypothetical protein
MNANHLHDMLSGWKFPGVFVHALLRPDARLLIVCPEDLPLFAAIRSKLELENARMSRIDLTVNVREAIEIGIASLKDAKPDAHPEDLAKEFVDQYEFVMAINSNSALEYLVEIVGQQNGVVWTQDIFHNVTKFSGVLPVRAKQLGFEASDFVDEHEMYLKRNRFQTMRDLCACFHALERMRPVPADFDAMAFETKIQAASQAGAGPLWITEKEQIGHLTSAEKEVLEWLAPVMCAIFSQSLPYSELMRIEARLTGECSELRGWLILFWFCMNLGLPTTLALRAIGPKATTFTKALELLQARKPGRPIWEPILEAFGPHIGTDLPTLKASLVEQGLFDEI